jgi:hypothetical protein
VWWVVLHCAAAAVHHGVGPNELRDEPGETAFLRVDALADASADAAAARHTHNGAPHTCGDAPLLAICDGDQFGVITLSWVVSVRPPMVAVTL